MIKIKRSVNFPDDLYDRLVKIGKRKNISTAAVVKMACSEYLEKEESKEVQKK